jgi:hypothetical protein
MVDGLEDVSTFETPRRVPFGVLGRRPLISLPLTLERRFIG